MDFKDKIILCLVAMVVVLAALNSAREQEQEQEQEQEPANEIIYNVVDDNGHVIGGFRLKK